MYNPLFMHLHLFVMIKAKQKSFGTNWQLWLSYFIRSLHICIIIFIVIKLTQVSNSVGVCPQSTWCCIFNFCAFILIFHVFFCFFFFFYFVHVCPSAPIHMGNLKVEFISVELKLAEFFITEAENRVELENRIENRDSYIRSLYGYRCEY